MKAVARLVLSYFNATLWSRCATLIGLCGITLAIVYSPTASLQTAQLLGVAGIAAFFFGSAMMPIMAGQLLRARSIGILPVGRIKVLTSAMLTAALTAIPLPIISALVMVASNSQRAPALQTKNLNLLAMLQTPFFWQMYLTVLLLCTWLYVVLWFGMRHRNSTPGIRAWLIAVLLIVVPPKYIRLTPDTHWTILLSCLVASWTLIAAFWIYGSRLREFEERLITSLRTRFRRPVRNNDETSLLLGTAHPWLVQFMLMTSFMIVANALAMPIAWISYLALCSLLTGAYSCNAAARSRALWLRRPWDRQTLFHNIEMHFWLNNSISRLTILLILSVSFGIYTKQSTAIITLTMLTVALGTAASTYLGLAITRRLGWLESTMTIGTMVLMMIAIYLFAWKEADVNVIAWLLFALGSITVMFRQIAKRRWLELDWMVCKPLRIA